MSVAEGVERRNYSRQRMHSLAYVELGQDNGGIVLNVGEGGLAVAAATPLSGDALPRIRFRLPGSASWIETSARIAWIADTKKEAGIVFLDLKAIDRTRIRLWIAAPEPASPAAAPRLRELTPPADTSEITPEPEAKPAPALIPIDRGASAAAPLPEAAAPRMGESWLRPEPPPRRWLPLVALIAACVLLSFVVGIMAGRGSWQDLRAKVGQLIARSGSGNPPAPPASAASQPPEAPAASEAPPATAAPSVSGVGSQPGSPSSSAIPHPAGPATSVAPAVPPPASAPSAAAAPPGVAPPAPAPGGVASAPSRPAQTVPQGNPPQNPALPPIPSAPASAVPAAPPAATTPAAAPPAPAAPPQSATAAPPANAAPTPPAGATVTPAAPASQSPPAAAAATAPAVPAAAAPPPAPIATPTGAVSVVTDVYPSIRLPAGAAASRSGMPLHLGALTSRVEPVYPPEALRRGIQGTVVLHILMGTDGTVSGTQVVSGPQALIGAARDAVARWRYQPTLLGNQRVETEADASITFRLTTPPAGAPAAAPAR